MAHGKRKFLKDFQTDVRRTFQVTRSNYEVHDTHQYSSTPVVGDVDYSKPIPQFVFLPA